MVVNRGQFHPSLILKFQAEPPSSQESGRSSKSLRDNFKEKGKKVMKSVKGAVSWGKNSKYNPKPTLQTDLAQYFDDIAIDNDNDDGDIVFTGMSNRARQTSDTSVKTTSTARKRKSQETFDGDEHGRTRRPRSNYDQMDINEKPDITKLDAPSTGSSTVVPVAGPSRGVFLSRGTVLSMRPTSLKKPNVDQMARRPGRNPQASIIPSQAVPAPLNPAQGLALPTGSASSTPSGFQGLALPPPSAQPSQARDAGSGSVFGSPFGFKTLVPSEPAPTVQTRPTALPAGPNQLAQGQGGTALPAG